MKKHVFVSKPLWFLAPRDPEGSELPIAAKPHH